MSISDWVKAGRFEPQNLIGGHLDLREALNRTEKLDSDTWLLVGSEHHKYALTRAELLRLRRELIERSAGRLADPLVISIDQLLDESDLTPCIQVNLPDKETDVGKILREFRKKLKDRVLVVSPSEDVASVWQRSTYGTILSPESPASSLPSAPMPEPVAAGQESGRTIFFPDDPPSRDTAPDEDRYFLPAEPEQTYADIEAGALPDSAGSAPDGSPGLLGDDASSPQIEPVEVDEPPAGVTYINAVIEEHQGGSLNVDTAYALDFSIDRQANRSLAAVASAATSEQLRNPGVETSLEIELYGQDFKIEPATQTLKLNKQGLSVAKARFTITPLRAGPAVLVVLIHKDGNFVQKLKIQLNVGQETSTPATVVAIGRPISAAATLRPRRIGMIIEKEEGYYSCRVWGIKQREVRLPITPAELDLAIDNLRRGLMKVVQLTDAAGKHPFQNGVDIPPSAADASLKILAEAGYNLFRTIFLHDLADEELKKLAKWLVAEATKDGPGFNLQILGQDFPIPWAALYLTPRLDLNALRWDNFLGMKHVIEQMPLGDYDGEAQITSHAGGLAVALNLNLEIDIGAPGGEGVVAKQSQYWQARAAGNPVLSLKTRTTTGQLVDALSNAETDDQISYFYCHAQSVGLAGGGPDTSTLTFGAGDFITLGQLKNLAPTTISLRGAPLVFINACESADLSSTFYSGFVPYFMSKGARGVIGTECKVPVLFAAAWAQSFFDEFLGGAYIGELVLMKRRAFYLDHNNLLGLLYGVHCNIDTQLVQSKVA